MNTPNDEIRQVNIQSIEQAMLEERTLLGPIFRRTVYGIILTLVVAIITLILLAVVPMENSSKVVISKLLQVSFGMVLGAACVIFGVVLSWLAVASAPLTVSVENDASPRKTRLDLATASPGMLLILGGIVLAGISLYRPVEYNEKLQGPDIQFDNSPTDETEET